MRSVQLILDEIAKRYDQGYADRIQSLAERRNSSSEGEDWFLQLTIPKTALSKHNGVDDHSTTKTFTLTETVPEGYLPVEGSPWTVTANGTEVTTVNEIVTTTYKWHVTSVGELTGDNYVYTIVNEEAPKDSSISITKKVTQNGAAPTVDDGTGTSPVDGTYTFTVKNTEATGVPADEGTVDYAEGQIVNKTVTITYVGGVADSATIVNNITTDADYGTTHAYTIGGTKSDDFGELTADNTANTGTVTIKGLPYIVIDAANNTSVGFVVNEGVNTNGTVLVV